MGACIGLAAVGRVETSRTSRKKNNVPEVIRRASRVKFSIFGNEFPLQLVKLYIVYILKAIKWDDCARGAPHFRVGGCRLSIRWNSSRLGSCCGRGRKLTRYRTVLSYSAKKDIVPIIRLTCLTFLGCHYLYLHFL